MSRPKAIVLDSSVGAKWIRAESGTEDAERLLLAHLQGELRIVVATHFLHEVMAVAVRERGPDRAVPVWENLADARLDVAMLDAMLVREALRQCRALGCTFYDALAPSLATLLDSPLYSADARAHGAFPGVRLLGA